MNIPSSPFPGTSRKADDGWHQCGVGVKAKWPADTVFDFAGGTSCKSQANVPPVVCMSCEGRVNLSWFCWERFSLVHSLSDKCRLWKVKVSTICSGTRVRKILLFFSLRPSSFGEPFEKKVDGRQNPNTGLYGLGCLFHSDDYQTNTRQQQTPIKLDVRVSQIKQICLESVCVLCGLLSFFLYVKNYPFFIVAFHAWILGATKVGYRVPGGGVGRWMDRVCCLYTYFEVFT